MPRPKRDGTTFFGLEIPDADYKFMKDAAIADDRPLSSLMRRIFREWIKQQQEVAKKKVK